jgi:hypothetical protein
LVADVAVSDDSDDDDDDDDGLAANDDNDNEADSFCNRTLTTSNGWTTNEVMTDPMDPLTRRT